MHFIHQIPIQTTDVLTIPHHIVNHYRHALIKL